METIKILLVALLPIVILAFYIYRRDKSVPEPIEQLLKAFFLGVLSLWLSLCMSVPFGWIGLYPEEPTTIFGSVRVAFFGAAIPEEIAKFVMLWLVLRKNRYFNENMDGIVYAVFVSLGFAAFENIMYVVSSDSYMSVGIVRALFAVPGHFCYGILMGYFISLASFCPTSSKQNYALALIAPIVAHGLYDAILMMVDVVPDIVQLILVILFLAFCYILWRYASKKIKKHLKRDGICQTN